MLDTVIYNNTVFNYLLALIVISAGFLTSKLFGIVFEGLINPITKKTKTDIDDTIAKLVEVPVQFFIIIAGFVYANDLLNLGPVISDIITKAFFMSIVFIGSYVGIKIIDLIMHKILLRITKKTKSDFDDHLIPLIRQVIKISLWIMTILLILDNFGFDIASIIAGLGVGGLAIALAAKDMLSNLFGGISIFLDQPFKPKDRIKLLGFDGTVENIGIRTTRIRTLDDRLLTIPNSKIADTVVENVTKEKARKIVMTLGLTYDTTNKKIEKAQEIIKDVILKNESTKDDCITSFTEFGDFSLNVLVVYWIEDKTNIMNARNEVNLEIKKRFEKSKIDFAFPTQTVEVIRKK